MSNTNSQPGTPIKGAVALVTGGHRGFGHAMVEELLERRAAKVYATYEHTLEAGSFGRTTEA